MFRKTFLFLIFALVFLTQFAKAQALSNQMSTATTTGALPYTTHEIAREDISLATGALHAYIPIVSLQGKGGQTLNLGWAYDSRPYSLLEQDNSQGWNDPTGLLYPYNYAVWSVSPDALGYITYPHLRASWLFVQDYGDFNCGSGGRSFCANYPLFCTANFVFRDEYGTNHSFYVSRDCSYTGNTNGQLIHTMTVKDVDDGSAMRLDASNPNDIIVRAKDGTAYHFPPVTTFPPSNTAQGTSNLLYYDNDFVKIVDPNGNTITKSGITITDSVGRTLTGLSWKDSNGQIQAVGSAPGGPVGPTVATDASNCSFNNPYQSNSQSVSSILGGGDLNGGHLANSYSLILPGGATYGFQFDSLGELTKINYPGGGYTRYDYQTFYPQMNLGNLTCFSDLREVSAKHVCSSNSASCTTGQEETTTYTPAFNGYLEGANYKTDVRDPLGNRTQYWFSALNLGNGSARNPRETDRLTYQGESQLARTVHTDYTNDSSNTSCSAGLGCFDYALPYKVTTTLNDISPPLISVVLTKYDTVAQNNNALTYDPPPLPLPQIIIDNPIETDEYDFTGVLARKTVYTWQKGGNYDPGTLHILNRPASQTITDPASGKQTTISYTYDTNGNMLTKGVGGTGITTLTTQYTYNSYGDATLVKDPLLHQTHYGYASPWYDTACAQSADSSGHPTYVTNALNQVTNLKYYSCTGLLATATDPNNQVTTYAFDGANRVASVTYANSGQTSNAYVDTAPQSVTTTTKVTTTPTVINEVTKKLLDGLGRENQNQLFSDPEGVTYGDTTYDADERVATVSNPYRSVSDPTYGLTSYVYDALGRVCVTVPSDITAVPTSCPTTPPSGSSSASYSGNLTTVTDEAGSQRASRTDALGRLIEVDEPGHSYTLSGGTGGNGSISITGPTCSIVQGGGTMSITINGAYTATANYTCANSAASLASTLAAQLNSYSLISATATSSGSTSGTVNIQALGIGAATNYPYSTSNVIQGQNLGYNISGSGSLSGGTDPNKVYNLTSSLSLSNPAITLYTYDALGNLTCVEQHGTANGTGCSYPPSNDPSSPWHIRRFTYDPLSRLLAATNPESGTISYTYDADSNVLTKGSPSPNKIPADTSAPLTLTTTYTYDLGNRLTKKSYSDTTAPVEFAYDGNTPALCTPPAIPAPGAANLVGRRSSMCDATGSAAWSYSPVGRPITETRLLTGVSTAKNINYGFNLDGSLAALTYPSGRKITYAPSGAGRTLSAIDTSNAVKYVTSALYAPQGGLSSMVNGFTSTFAGITTTNSYNKRLQSVTLSAAAPSQTVLSLSYNLHLGTGDNGNIYQIVNNRDTTRNANYLYDPLNRILQANTVATTGTNCWGEAFAVDAWGNLTGRSGVAGMTGCSTEALTATPASNNRIASYCYDIAGNLLGTTPCPSLPYTPTNTYDAENRLLSPATGFSYAYDGKGERVKKCTNTGCTTGTLYWKGSGSDTLLESSVTGSGTEEYIFFNGKRVARRDASNSAVHYYFSDHLGSASVITSATGTSQEESDYYPYGGERVITNGDPNTYKFTGKERDAESGLDNFGARYMASTMGRFMSADPSRLSVFFTNPQSWNRYSYVYNNPLRLTDDNGKWPTDIHNQIIDNSFPNLTAAQRQILKNVSAQQDSILGGGQANSASFEHAMRGPNQTVEQAQGQFNDFVSGTETSAQTAEWTFWLNDPDNAGSLSDEALARFAEALHAILDSTSPAHAGFQKWDWRNPGLIIAHHNAEKTINPQQMLNAVTSAQNAFNLTFGNFGFTAPPPKEHVTHKICYTDDKGKQVCQ